MEQAMSEDYRKYKEVREVAWKMLINHKISSLPVSVMKISKQLNITILSYTEASELIDICGLKDHSTVNDGFTVYTDRWYILFSPDIEPASVIRFILARELGRIILGHKMEHIKVGFFTAFYSNELLDVAAENDAVQFAVRLLSPACALKELNILEAQDIMQKCGLNEEQSIIRSRRMSELILKNRFLTHPLEIQVNEQFKPYYAQNN